MTQSPWRHGLQTSGRGCHALSSSTSVTYPTGARERYANLTAPIPSARRFHFRFLTLLPCATIKEISSTPSPLRAIQSTWTSTRPPFSAPQKRHHHLSYEKISIFLPKNLHDCKKLPNFAPQLRNKPLNRTLKNNSNRGVAQLVRVRVWGA